MGRKKGFPGGVRFAPIVEIRKLESRAEGEAARYEVAVSSEFAVERQDWFDGVWREVLDHSADSIELGRFQSGTAAVLEEHRGVPIGVIEDVTLGKDRVLRATVRFSKSQRGQDAEQDVADGIRQNISVGYIPKVVKMVEQDEKKGDLWRVMKWEPVELSLVGIPADPTVGVGRSMEAGIQPVVVLNSKGVRSMDPNEKPPEKPEEGEQEPAPEITPAMTHVEIIRMCERNGCAAMAAEFIEQGLNPDQVARKLLEVVKTRGPAIRSNSDMLKSVPTKDRSRYSYARAIHRAAASRDGTGIFDGLEAEVSRELERQKPQGYQGRGGFFIPIDLRSAEQQWEDGVARRTLDSKTLSKGSETVFETPGELIELLRSRAATILLGAQSLTGLQGPVAFPKQTGAMNMSWVAENAGDVNETDVALGLVTLQPKTLQGATSYSRQLLAQSSIDVETLVRNELAIGHALAIDRAVIHGAGNAGEPTGIYIAPDVQPKAIGAFAAATIYGLLVDMIGLVADKNAAAGALGWLTTPLAAAKFRQTPEHTTATMANWLWQGTLETGGSGTIAGYRAYATNQVSKTLGAGANEHGIVFGDWSQIIIGLFASMEIVVDPYAKKKRGLIEVASFQMADLILRHGESFVKGTGMTIP